MLCVIFNTVILTLDGIVEDNITFQLMNLIFTYIFLTEMIIKIIGFGIKGYV